MSDHERRRQAGVLRKDYIGLRVGMLLCIGRSNKKPEWEFRCDCGRSIHSRIYEVKRRKWKHCGACGLTPNSTYPKTFSVDLNTNKARLKRWVVQFPSMEAKLLNLLRREWPAVVPHDKIIATLWPDREPGNPPKCVKTYVHNIRKPLRTMGATIEPDYGVGYRLVLPSQSKS